MASRIIHLAVADALEQHLEVRDRNRFRLGSIVADAKMDSVLRNAPHFLRRLPDGRVCYGLSEFLRLYGDRLPEDELYLGYYLHLIQDAEYRRYMYMEHGWDATTPGNVEKLHSDYRKINRYVIARHSLENDISAPADFEAEEINRLFGFDLGAFLAALQGDFDCDEKGEYFFFTPEMAEEFIVRAAEVCLHEVEALRMGLPLYDEVSKAWGGKSGT